MQARVCPPNATPNTIWSLFSGGGGSYGGGGGSYGGGGGGGYGGGGGGDGGSRPGDWTVRPPVPLQRRLPPALMRGDEF